MTDETDKGTVTESESEKSALKGEESLESVGKPWIKCRWVLLRGWADKKGFDLNQAHRL